MSAVVWFKVFYLYL